MAALDDHRRTGEGQYIDQAQMESALHFLAPELLECQVSGRTARRAGNDAPDASPHDVYPCAGTDEWCAIAVETDAQWRALRRALGEPQGAEAPARGAHAALAGRRRPRRHGAALERPPRGSAAPPPQVLPPAPPPRDGRGAVRGPPVLHLGVRQRAVGARALSWRALDPGVAGDPRSRR